jgi:integrase
MTTISPTPEIVNVVLNKRGATWHCLMVDADGNVVKNAVARDGKAMRYVFEDLRDGFGSPPGKNEEAGDKGGEVGNVSEAGRSAGNIESLAKFWKNYLHFLKTSGKSESTIRTYQLAYDEVIRNNRITRVEELELERIESWAKEKLASGLRRRSVNFYVRNIKAALEWGVDNLYLRRNPLEAWEPVGEKEPVERRDLSPNDLRAVIAAEPHEEWRVRWAVYLYSGFRNRSEGALRWEWIDWRNRVVAFPAKPNDLNSRARQIAMHSELHEALSSWRDKKLERGENAEFGPVLRPRTPRTISQRLKEVARQAGIADDSINLFSIRHTYEAALREEKRYEI